MRSLVRLAAAALLALAPVAVACSSDAAPRADAGEGDAVVLVDVRTPSEFAAGHLEGAINLDYEGGLLEAALDDLDPSVTYAVYCHSGRRSALAIGLMVEKGFTFVTDLGGLAEAAQTTGLAVVTG